MSIELEEAGRPAFDVKQRLKHAESGAICVVLARSDERTNGEWFYHVRCVSEHEPGVERWWNERALDVEPDPIVARLESLEVRLRLVTEALQHVADAVRVVNRTCQDLGASLIELQQRSRGNH